MKKSALSVFVVLVFGLYVWNQKSEAENVQAIPPSTTNSSSATSNPTSIDQGSKENSGSSSQATGSLKDGEYTSEVGDAFYGPLQIKTTISNGKISDVSFLKYPDDRPTSKEINGQAMPLLKQEAIQNQNSNVDIITGATQTSDAFKIILQSTLNKAKS